MIKLYKTVSFVKQFQAFQKHIFWLEKLSGQNLTKAESPTVFLILVWVQKKLIMNIKYDQCSLFLSVKAIFCNR